MPNAILIAPMGVLTNEDKNDTEAVALIRQIVATAGVRVTEQALAAADAFAVESFAPNTHDAIIFRLVNRDTTLALRCISAFKKNFKPVTQVRPEAVEILQSCRNRGWRVAFVDKLTDEQKAAFERAHLMKLVDIPGPPPAMKIELPDPRALEFLVGTLGVMPGDCVMLGTRVDNNIRPANLVRMTTLHLQEGKHGKLQLPRDLKDVPDYEAPSVEALLNVIPTVV